MVGCYARRDGCNDNVTPNGYAGLRIVGTSGATPHCPVVVTGFGTHVAKGDNNDGIASPDYGIRIDTAARVSLVGCIVAGTIAGIQDNTSSANIIGCKSHITNGSFTTTYDPAGRVIIPGSAGADREIQFNTTGSGKRWALRANSTAEGGSNTGSDLAIGRYDDTGAFIDTSIFIQRSTGNIGVGINSTPSARVHMERSDGGIVYLARQTAASNTAAILAIEGQSASSAGIQIGVQGDTIRRYGVKQDGTVEWGPGAAGTRDTNLYRSGADILKTDDALVVTDAFTPKVVSGAPTDGSFLHAPPDGTFAVDNTNSRLYIRLGGVWKSVTLT